jgi:hypothetical protein
MKSTGVFVALCFMALFFESCKKEQAPSAPTVPELNSKLAAVGLAPLTVITIAGNRDAEEGYIDGTGNKALFTSPLGIGLGLDGNLLIADTRTNKIRQVTPAGVVTTLNIPNAAGGVPLLTPYTVKQKSDGTIVIYSYEFENGDKTRIWLYQFGHQPTQFTLNKNASYAGISPDPYLNQYWTGGLENTVTGQRGFVERVLPSGKIAENYYLPLDRLAPEDRNFPIVHKIFAGNNGVKYLLINNSRFYKYTASGISRIWPDINLTAFDDMVANKDSRTIYITSAGKIYRIDDGKMRYLVGPNAPFNGHDGVGKGADVFAHNLALSKDEDTLYFTDVGYRTIRKVILK